MIRASLQIALDPKRGVFIDIPAKPNAENVDLIWACLHHFRTGEPLQFNSRLELATVAETERLYAKQRKWRR